MVSIFVVLKFLFIQSRVGLLFVVEPLGIVLMVGFVLMVVIVAEFVPEVVILFVGLD